MSVEEFAETRDERLSRAAYARPDLNLPPGPPRPPSPGPIRLGA